MTPPRPQAEFFEKKAFSETAQFRKSSVQVPEKVYVTKQIETLPDWGGGAGSRSVSLPKDDNHYLHVSKSIVCKDTNE